MYNQNIKEGIGGKILVSQDEFDRFNPLNAAPDDTDRAFARVRTAGPSRVVNIQGEATFASPFIHMEEDSKSALRRPPLATSVPAPPVPPRFSRIKYKLDGPPKAASGPTWPTQKPLVAPENLPSVINATFSPLP